AAVEPSCSYRCAPNVLRAFKAGHDHRPLAQSSTRRRGCRSIVRGGGARTSGRHAWSRHVRRTRADVWVELNATPDFLIPFSGAADNPEQQAEVVVCRAVVRLHASGVRVEVDRLLRGAGGRADVGEPAEGGAEV